MATSTTLPKCNSSLRQTCLAQTFIQLSRTASNPAVPVRPVMAQWMRLRRFRAYTEIESISYARDHPDNNVARLSLRPSFSTQLQGMDSTQSIRISGDSDQLSST